MSCEKASKLWRKWFVEQMGLSSTILNVDNVYCIKKNNNYKSAQRNTDKFTNLFIASHDVSGLPMTRRTPSRMSRIVSGGALSARISPSVSFLMLPTAAFACWIIGSISANSLSICPFRFPSFSCSSDAFFDSSSISAFCVLAFCIRQTTTRDTISTTNCSGG